MQNFNKNDTKSTNNKDNQIKNYLKTGNLFLCNFVKCDDNYPEEEYLQNVKWNVGKY